MAIEQEPVSYANVPLLLDRLQNSVSSRSDDDCSSKRERTFECFNVLLKDLVRESPIGKSTRIRRIRQRVVKDVARKEGERDTGVPGRRSRSSSQNHSLNSNHNELFYRLLTVEMELRKSRWFECADALNLLTKKLLAEEEEGSSISDSSSSSHFPSSSMLNILLSLAQLPSSSKGFRPPPLGPLSGKLLSESRGYVNPDSVIKPMQGVIDRDELNGSNSSRYTAAVNDDSTSCNYQVYGENSLFHLLEKRQGVFGTAIYPSHVFTSASTAIHSLFPLDDEEARRRIEGPPSTSSFGLSSSAQVDPTLFSTLLHVKRGNAKLTPPRSLGGAVNLRLTSVPDVDGDDEPRDIADVVLEEHEKAKEGRLGEESHFLRATPESRRRRRGGGGRENSSSSRVGSTVPKSEQTGPTPKVVSPPSPWLNVGWESTSMEDDDREDNKSILPQPPRLLTQDGSEACESEIARLLLRRQYCKRKEAIISAETLPPPPVKDVARVSEMVLVEHAFNALSGLPSDTFAYDPGCMSLRPMPRLRSFSRSPTAVGHMLESFSEAATCFVRLEGLVKEVRESHQADPSSLFKGQQPGRTGGGGERQGSLYRGRVLLAFMNALSGQLVFLQALVDNYRKDYLKKKSSKVIINSSNTDKSLTNLLHVFTSTQALRSRLIFLAKLCHCHSGSKELLDSQTKWQPWQSLHQLPSSSTLFLSYLYDHVQREELLSQPPPPPSKDDSMLPSERVLLLFLLQEASRPYLYLMAKWLYQGNLSVLDDPYREFPIRRRPTQTEERRSARPPSDEDDPSGSNFLRMGFEECERNRSNRSSSPDLLLPNFFPPSLAHRVIMAGKLLHLLDSTTVMQQGPPPPRYYYQRCAMQQKNLPRLSIVSSSRLHAKIPSSELTHPASSSEFPLTPAAVHTNTPAALQFQEAKSSSTRSDFSLSVEEDNYNSDEETRQISRSLGAKDQKQEKGSKVLDDKPRLKQVLGEESTEGRTSNLFSSCDTTNPRSSWQDKSFIHNNSRKEEEEERELASMLFRLGHEKETETENISSNVRLTDPISNSSQSCVMTKDAQPSLDPAALQQTVEGIDDGCQFLERCSDEKGKNSRCSIDETAAPCRLIQRPEELNEKEKNQAIRSHDVGHSPTKFDFKAVQEEEEEEGMLDITNLTLMVQTQCSLVEKMTVAYMVEEKKTFEHIKALRRYLLGTESALLKEFVATLQTQMLNQKKSLAGSALSSFRLADWLRPSNFLTCFNQAVMDVGLESDPYLSQFTYLMKREALDDLHRCQGATQDPSFFFSTIFQYLEGCYNPPWPLGLVFPPHVLATYGGVHRLLLRLHWIVHHVHSSREEVRAASKMRSSNVLPPTSSSFLLLRACNVLLHRLSSVADVFLEHVVAQIEGDSWLQLQTFMNLVGQRPENGKDHGETNVTLAHLRQVHELYITKVASRCFLPPAAKKKEKEEEDALYKGIDTLLGFIAQGSEQLERTALIIVESLKQEGEEEEVAEIRQSLNKLHQTLLSHLETLYGALEEKKMDEGFKAHIRGGDNNGHDDYCALLRGRIFNLLLAQRAVASSPL